MKKEKIVLSFIAVLLGLLAAGVAFYLYQLPKTIPPSERRPVAITPVLNKESQSQNPKIFLVLDSPKDEEVVETRTVTVLGKTTPEATIVIITSTNDYVITPAKNGNFSTTVSITDGQNRIEVKAISPSGDEATIVRNVTFSTESF